MSYQAPGVNPPSTADFLSIFPGQHLFRAIHPKFIDPKQTPQLATQTYYGNLAGCEAVLKHLNAHGWGVYFTPNDPKKCSAKQSDFSEMRAIYQDADDPTTSLTEPYIDGQYAHAVWQTSPGKFQRIWLTDPLPVELIYPIQNCMVEWHAHDAQAEGVQRLLRLPGYRNTKYPELPLVTLLRLDSSLPALSLARVTKYFGIGGDGDPNTLNAMEGIQRSGDQPRNNVIDLNRARPKRSPVTDRANENDATAKQLKDQPPGTLETSRLLDVLSLLDPDMSRNEWRRVIGALHWMSDGGLYPWAEDIAERWSAMGHKFEQGSFRKHWAGLKSEHDKPTHWGTLEGMARQCKETKAAKERRQSLAFQVAVNTHGAFLECRFLVMHFPVMRRSNDVQTVERDSIHNVESLLSYLGLRVRFDDFAHDIRVNETDILNNAQLISIWTEAQRHKFLISQPALMQYIQALAMQSKFNPALDYFNSLRGKWDGVPRLESFPRRHLGSPDSISVREAFILFMVAIIRRVSKPGYKFDLMPIFEGQQGIGKSSLFRQLMPDASWFSESPRLDLEEKRLYQLIQGKLVIEFGELAGKRTTEIEKIKKFVSQQLDEFIPNHAVRKESIPRVACFIGTTNELAYLRDTTGNRRFPIIPVNRMLDWGKLEAEKTQLWAEAVFMEDIWDSQMKLSDQAVADMESVQETRLDLDIGVSEIVEELEQFEAPFIKSEAIWQRMGIPHQVRAHRNFATNKQAFKQLRQMLVTHGWKVNTSARVNGEVVKGHFLREEGKTLNEVVYTDKGFAYKEDADQQTLEDLS